MAYYDPRTDKIYGAKKGSLVYWYGKGHQYLFKKGITSKINVFILISVLFGWAMFIIQNFNISQVAFIIVLGLIALKETFCWIYAFKNKYGAKK